MSQHLDGMVPSAIKVYAFLRWLEEAYDVSITFWLQIEKYGSNPPTFWVYAAGSGRLYDDPFFAGRVHRSPILEAQAGSIHPALWAILRQLEKEFSMLQRPKTDRPTL